MTSRAVIGALRVNLGLDSAQFQNGLRDAQSSLQSFGKKARNFGAAVSAAFSIPAGAFFTSVARSAGGFEQTLDVLGSTLGATAEQIQEVGQQARELGLRYAQGAGVASDAALVLAKNGLSLQDIMQGALEASLKFAAATGGDVAASADLATDIMLQFNKEASDLGGVVDVLAGVLNASKFGFDDIRLAIGQAGGVAASAGVTFEDLAAGISATSQNFASGSDAGTSFKNFITRLTGVSKEARAEIEALGLSFFDQAGQMRPLRDIAEDLSRVYSGMSDSARVASMQIIFGVDAMRTASGLAAQGAEGIDRFSAALQGVSAESLATDRLDNFNGAMARLGAAFDELKLAVADSGFLDALTGIVEAFAAGLRYLADLPEGVKRFAVGLGVLAAVVGPIVGTIGLFVAGLAAISAPVAAVIAGVAALAAALFAFGEDIMAFLEGAWRAMQDAFEGAVDWVSSVATAFSDLASGALDSVGRMVLGVISWLQDRLGAVFDWVVDKVGAVKDAFFRLYDDVVGNSYVPDMVDGIAAEFGRLPQVMVEPALDATGRVSAGFRDMKEESDGLGEIWDSFSGRAGGAIDRLIDGTYSWRDALKDALSVIEDIARQQLGGGTGGSSKGGLIAGLLGSVASGIAGTFSSTGFGFGNSLATHALASGANIPIIASADGNVFSGNRLKRFASGTVISSPTMFPLANGAGLMAEAGPEAIMPLTRGPDGKLGVRSHGGGGARVMNLTINATDADSIKRSRGQLSAQIGDAVRRGEREYR